MGSFKTVLTGKIGTYLKYIKQIPSVLLYDGLSEEEYNSIKADIHERNRKNLEVYSFILCVAMAFLYCFSFFATAIEPNRYDYLLVCFFMIVFYFLVATVAKQNIVITVILNYIFCLSIFALGIAIGIFSMPDQYSVCFCVSLAIMPFATYDCELRAGAFRLCICFVYTIFAFNYKETAIISQDLIDIYGYYLLGTVAVLMTRKKTSLSFYVQRLRDESKKNDQLTHELMAVISSIIETKDEYTKGHSERVAQYAREIARKSGKSDEESENIYYIAMLHDVGKIGIPKSIINKNGKLTPEEYNTIKEHPEKGYNILSNLKGWSNITDGARYHHERYDGKGYPFGLESDNIPEIARIIAVADAYDAMTSNRSYRSMLPKEKVIEEIEKGKKTQFDPNFAEIMLKIIEEDKDYAIVK